MGHDGPEPHPDRVAIILMNRHFKRFETADHEAVFGWREHMDMLKYFRPPRAIRAGILQ